MYNFASIPAECRFGRGTTLQPRAVHVLGVTCYSTCLAKKAHNISTVETCVGFAAANFDPVKTSPLPRPGLSVASISDVMDKRDQQMPVGLVRQQALGMQRRCASGQQHVGACSCCVSQNLDNPFDSPCRTGEG
jgi:hypothetical protein